jgi:hypothetical protein
MKVFFIGNKIMPHNYRLKLTARVFLAERPQLKRIVKRKVKLKGLYKTE